MTSALPDWVRPGKLAYYKPERIVFPVGHCQQRQQDGQLRLLDGAKGESFAAYPLDDCEPATLKHFGSVTLMTVNGRPVSVVRQGNLLVFSNDRRRVVVAVDTVDTVDDDTRRAANSIAQFFNGEIVQEA
jgi:hypothetical protein